MTIETLVVEDNKFTRAFFEGLVERQEGLHLAGTLKDAEQAPSFCRINRVDLILMDVQTQHGHSGLTAAARIRAEQPGIRIVVVTSLVDAAVLEKARAVGVDSLWYKDHGEEEIMDVVRRTLAGERIFPDRPPNVEVGSAWSDDLSETQKEILRRYIQGDTYAAIGRALFLQERTVKYHMDQMIQKCGFQSKQQLIAAAIDSTIVAALDD